MSMRGRYGGSWKLPELIRRALEGEHYLTGEEAQRLAIYIDELEALAPGGLESVRAVAEARFRSERAEREYQTRMMPNKPRAARGGSHA